MRILVIVLIAFFSFESFAQVHNLIELKPDSFKTNVTVEKLDQDKHQCSYLIWVSDSVRPHYHASHTESIYVLEGGGLFYLGNEVYQLKPGDYITIPEGTVHSFKKIEGKRAKVLSIQTPEFFGKDRIWVEKQQ